MNTPWSATDCESLSRGVQQEGCNKSPCVAATRRGNAGFETSPAHLVADCPASQPAGSPGLGCPAAEGPDSSAAVTEGFRLNEKCL